MKVVFEGLSIDFLRGRFDSLEDIRGVPIMDLMGEMIFMGPAREAHIHLHQMELQFGSDKKVNSEIHTQYTKKQVIDSPDLFFFSWILTVIKMGKWAIGAPSLLGKGPDE